MAEDLSPVQEILCRAHNGFYLWLEGEWKKKRRKGVVFYATPEDWADYLFADADKFFTEPGNPNEGLRRIVQQFLDEKLEFFDFKKKLRLALEEGMTIIAWWQVAVEPVKAKSSHPRNRILEDLSKLGPALCDEYLEWLVRETCDFHLKPTEESKTLGEEEKQETRGRKPNPQVRRRRQIVKEFCKSGKFPVANHDFLPLCEELDKEGIPLPESKEKKYSKYKKFSDIVESDSDDALGDRIDLRNLLKRDLGR